jgi:phosphorylcholine metabolism protein LicD
MAAIATTRLFIKSEFLKNMETYADKYDSIISKQTQGSSDSNKSTNSTYPTGRGRSINDLTEKEWAEWQGD